MKLVRKKTNKSEKVKVKQEKEQNVLRATFGSHRFSKPIKELMKDIDKELHNI